MYYFKEPIHEKLILNPQTYEGNYRDEKSEGLETRRICGTYLHGELQDKNGYDIFGIVGEVPKYAGIYPCKVLGINEQCSFFLWIGKDGRAHGLVVANSNKKDVEYAMDCYKQRKSTL